MGYVWTGEFDLNTLRVDGEIFESGKKKLRIQKYPDFLPSTGKVIIDHVLTNGDDSKLINLAASRIKIYYFGRQISTFCRANTLKTECVVHWIAERETTGLTL